MSIRPRVGIPLACVALVLGVVSPVRASVVTYMDTETLVRLSPVIVRGEVEAIVSRSDTAYTRIHTDVTIRVAESLKGAAGQDRITVRLAGGSVNGHESYLFGSPEFRKGERVLVFAQAAKRGGLTVTGLFQGKFRIESDAGVEIAVQEKGDAGVVFPPNQRREAGQRPLAALLEEVRNLAKRHPAPSVATPLPTPAADDAVSSTDLGFSFINPIFPLRWFEADTGTPVTMKFNPADAPTVVPGGARPQFVAATQNWTNVPGSTIVVQDGGDTTETCRFPPDGVSSVTHADPCGDIMAPFDPISCSGVLAVTGVDNFYLQSKVVNGVSFLRLREVDIIFNAGTDCFFVDPGNYGEVIGHEMGHFTGLGHSCGDRSTPACAPGTVSDDATMRAFAHGDGRGPVPHEGDINGVRFIYPPPGFVDAKLDGTSFTTGQTMNLTADFNGTDRADLYVLLALPGGGFIALGASAPNTLAPLATNLQLGFAVDAPLFSLTFTGSAPAGAYTWFTLLVRPGTNPTQTANWLSVDSAPFTFTP